MKKPSIAVVLGMGKPKSEDGESEESEDSMEYSEDQSMMAEELMDAVKKGDSKLFLEAFHGLFKSYEMTPHEEG